MTSTIPLKFSSLPIGSWRGMALALRRSLIMLTTLSKSAPLMSILLTNAILGTLYLVA